MISVTLFVKPTPRLAPKAYYSRDKRIVFFDPQSDLLRDLRVQTIVALKNQGRTLPPYKKEIPIVVHVECCFSAEKVYKKNTINLEISREAYLRRVVAEGHHTTVPDCDNMAKLYLDVAKNIMFEDDRQVTNLTVSKKYDLYESVAISCWGAEEGFKPMETSSNGISLIKKYEGLKKEPYICAGGEVTIGYGHVILPSDEDLGSKISTATATKLLLNDVKKSEEQVSRLVNPPLNQNEFDALVSFVFNVGTKNFYNSTLRKKLNDNKSKEEIANEFDKWVWVKRKKSNGLKRRREAEKTLFLKPITEEKGDEINAV